MKQQVFVIHGGNAFDKYEDYFEYLKEKEISIERTRFIDWKGNLQKNLGDSYDVILPRMPNSQNARYVEWEIVFDKFVSQLDENIIFIGHSLGGIFLAKYLSEKVYPKSIKAVFLVAAPYNTPNDHPCVDFNLLTDLSGLEKQVDKVFIYHSQDDQIVPFSNFIRYQKEIPKATSRIFTDKQHFNQEDFPELISDIQNL
jgi:predicted alpha/beta hydrolase family esterase